METDIRDYMGELVISHDIAQQGCLSIKTFFSLYSALGSQSLLALNIKADGLQKCLKALLEYYGIRNYFVFDMTVPEAIQYNRNKFYLFTRQSEYETDLPLYNQAVGVWADCFEHEWISRKEISTHLANGKKVCIVSPELHSRPHRPFWSKLAETGLTARSEVMLCTDFPQDAQEFFNGKN
jgi:hypothetical protein